MTILEELYEFNIKKRLFYNRKVTIKERKSLIIAPKMSGVSSLIFDYLSEFKQKEYLYIDLEDFRVEITLLKEKLEEFIIENRIKILVIENYNREVPLPDIETIILTSNVDIEIDNFSKLYLYPLDFEEFISFDKKFSTIEHIFSNFSNSSTYPEFIINRNLSTKEYQERLKVLFCKKIELIIIKELAKFQSEKISIFQIFNIIKQNYKISKDTFYTFIERLEREKFIFLVNRYNSSRFLKKLYFLDFNLKNRITIKKNFIKRFENMLFLELMKRGKEIFYGEKVEFYLPKEKIAILSIPFYPLEIIKKKIELILKENSIEIKKIIVVTMELENEYNRDNIKIEIMPFWNFVFSLEEVAKNL